MGAYAFVCTVHPEMTGTVLVADKPGEVPTAVPTATPTPTAHGPGGHADAHPGAGRAGRDAGAKPAVPWATFEQPVDQTVASLAAGKFKLTARCAGAAKGTLTLTVSRSAARRLKLKSVTLGSATASCDGHNRFAAKIKMSRTVKRALAKYRGIARRHRDPATRQHEGAADDDPRRKGAVMTDITRRSALRQGFGGIALVCSFDFDKRKPSAARDERLLAPEGVRSVRALPARPARSCRRCDRSPRTSTC